MDEMVLLINDCKRMKIQLGLPDINECFSEFTIDKNNSNSILFGLSAIKNVGKTAVDNIVKEREEHGAYIEATIFLERESHKPIVIGEAGRMIKKIGTAARKEIEAMSGRKIFLEIKVKVRKNWRDDDKVLRQFGY